MRDIENQKYSGMAMFLHWVMALMIIANIAIIKYMQTLPRAEKGPYYYQHEAIGTTVLILILWRLYWRLTHKPPALPASTTGLAALAAHAGHWTLYGMMILVPLTGFLQVSLYGSPIGLWLFSIPSQFTADKVLAKSFSGFHDILGNLLMFLVAGHFVFALIHQFYKRDKLISRMMP